MDGGGGDVISGQSARMPAIITGSPRFAVGVGTLHLDFPSRILAPLRRGFPCLAAEPIASPRIALVRKPLPRMCLVPTNLSLAPHTQPGAGHFLQHDCERQPDIARNPELGPCLRWLILGGVAGLRAARWCAARLSKKGPASGGAGL
jgi:hypothetical protein